MVEGSTQPGPTFTLVYATPLLQHQAQFGLKRIAMSMSVSVSACESVRESIFPKLHIQSSHFCARLAAAMHFLYYVTGLSASKRRGRGWEERGSEGRDGPGRPI